jgi:hypothetical protein
MEGEVGSKEGTESIRFGVGWILVWWRGNGFLGAGGRVSGYNLIYYWGL